MFTANAGIVDGRQFVPAALPPSRAPGRDADYDVAWFDGARATQVDAPARRTLDHEGAGDALPFGGVLLSGYRCRSDAAPTPYLSRLTGAPVRSVELVDERLLPPRPHVLPARRPPGHRRPDGLGPLRRAGDRGARARAARARATRPSAFCANSVVVGRNIVMPSCPPRVGRQLEAWGFDVVVADVTSSSRPAAACRCLTLALDVVLRADAASTPPAPT